MFCGQECNSRPGEKQWQPTAGFDKSHVWNDYLETGISSSHNACIECESSLSLPFYASAANAVSDALCFRLDRRDFCSVPSSAVPRQIYILIYFNFARILNGFRRKLREAICTTHRYYDYILGKVRREQEQDTREYSNQRQSVLPRCQTGAYAQRMNSQISLHRRHQMRSRTKFSRYFKDFKLQISRLQLSYIKILQHFFSFIGLLIQYRLTADVDTSFIAPFCLPWQRRCGKHLQRISDECSGGGIM